MILIYKLINNYLFSNIYNNMNVKYLSLRCIIKLLKLFKTYFLINNIDNEI